MALPLVKIIAPLVITLLATQVSAKDYQSGNYPRFAQAQLFSTGESVTDKPNVVEQAIEEGASVALKYNKTFIGAKNLLFPSNYFGSSYNANKLATKAFVDVLSSVVSNFTCAEYRFRKRMPESDGCNGYVVDNDILEGMPFVSGQYVTNRLEAHIDDKRNGVSFTAYLKSAEEKPLNFALGSVHELGTFFGGFADRRSLVLSLHLEAYWWSPEKQRMGRINQEPFVYFLVLPRSVDIARNDSERSSANYSLRETKILIVNNN
ncbi:hypothetical protein Q2Y22_001289 [Vibrio vulnificus]|nr:hypothetical protein [Vibrio vulnificus]